MKQSRLSRAMAVILIGMLVMMAAAMASAPEPEMDPTRKGSFSIVIRDPVTKQPISGGTLEVYRVADFTYVDEQWVLNHTGYYTGSGLPLTDLMSSTTVEAYENYTIVSKAKSDIKQKIGSSGSVQFTNMSAGLYLVRQTAKNKQKTMINSFLISVPQHTSQGFLYQFDASPKISIEPAVTNPPSDSNKSYSGSSSSLPQTGQLWWPIPVLLFVGIVLILLGRRKPAHEKAEK